MTACLRPCVLALVVLILLLAGCPAPRIRLAEEPPPPERAAGEQWGCVFVDEADAAANEMETEGIAFCAPDREPRLLFDGEFSTFDALPTGDLALISSTGPTAIRVTVIGDAAGAGTEVSARDLLGLSWADCRWRPDGGMLAVWSTDTEAGAPLLVGGRTGEFTRVADGVVDLVGWGRR